MPALPRASSATSGFSFCGIIDEPVAAVLARGARSRTPPSSRGRAPRRSARDATKRTSQRRRGSRARSRGRRQRRASSASRRDPPLAGARASSRRARRRRAAARAAAAPAARKRRAVAVEHLDPREQVVADRDRLGALQVRVAGNAASPPRARRRRGPSRAKRLDRGAAFARGVGHVEAERGRDLVVSRPACVDLASHRPEQPLDRRVDVLVLARGDLAFGSDFRETPLDFGQLLVRRGFRPRGVGCAWSSVPSQS